MHHILGGSLENHFFLTLEFFSFCSKIILILNDMFFRIFVCSSLAKVFFNKFCRVKLNWMKLNKGQTWHLNRNSESEVPTSLNIEAETSWPQILLVWKVFQPSFAYVFENQQHCQNSVGIVLIQFTNASPSLLTLLSRQLPILNGPTFACMKNQSAICLRPNPIKLNRKSRERLCWEYLI